MDMPKFLGAARSGRGKVNMMVIVVAFVLSIMVVNTYNQCNKNAKGTLGSKDQIAYGSYVLAILVIVACVLLFGYDMAVSAGLF
jgi:hypothetical protein